MGLLDVKIDTKGEIRERVLRTARAHFFSHGFRRVTMDELAAELGMSKKTVYQFFSGKSELLLSVIDQKLSQVDSDLERITKSPDADFAGTLGKILHCVQTHTEEISPSFLRDLERDTPELFARIQARRREIIGKHFERLIQAGRRAGLVRTDIAPHIIIEILLSTVHGIMHPAKLREMNLSPKSAFSASLQICLQGALLRTPEVSL